MLSVQSVNFKPAFGYYDPKYGDVIDVEYTKVDYTPSDEFYSKEDYSKDKAELERQRADVKSLAKDTNIPKPLRALANFASVGIGAGLGFIGMKYGAQGVIKLVNNGFNWVKSLGKKQAVKSVSEFFGDIVEKYNKTGFAKKIADIETTVKNYQPVKVLMNKCSEIKKAVSEVLTPDRIEKGTVNLFAVSGGVTGGVTALQEVSKD